ncbi:DUF1549 domain-containing protein [Singulisphaera rosea]
MIHPFLGISAALALMAASSTLGAEMTRAVPERFASPEGSEVPDFQRHVLPLLGRLGCNTRSCHGSFQGRGDFRLSLFGYDFKTDHDALLKDKSGRVVLDDPEASKILQKPTLASPHKGGKRLEKDSWQYQLLVRWVEAGAKGVTAPSRFERLEVIPSEVVLSKAEETVSLRVIAYWADGSREDVTPLARFRTNDESVAEVDEAGVVTAKERGDTSVVVFYDNGVAIAQVLRPVASHPGTGTVEAEPAATKVDELIQNKLRKLGIVPSEVCTDSEFLRRLSLDMTGTLPTPEEVEAFVADVSPGKREKKTEELLARPTYAAWWTNLFCDFTGNAPRNLNLQQGTTDQPTRFWYEWIYRRIKENYPYNEIVSGIVLATSRKPGQSYEEFAKEESLYHREKDPADFSRRETMPYFWARGNVRRPEEKALAFSYTFLGVRLECAQCHKHPFDQWTQDDLRQFTAFFQPISVGLGPEKETREVAQKIDAELGLKPGLSNLERNKILATAIKVGTTVSWREVFIAPAAKAPKSVSPKNTKPAKTGRVITPKLLGGEEVSIVDRNDPRTPLMEWLASTDNPYFARAFVNRVWDIYFGSGIINPPDDMNLANPPSNPALLDYLAEGFVSHGYDMQWLHREITTSRAYQRSWRPNDTNELDERNFSRALIRRLPAEVLIDAVSQATASTADLRNKSRMADERAIGPRGSPGIRPVARREYAAKVFGRASRETNCDCSRSNEPNLLQSIYLQNDQELLSAITRPQGWVAETVGSYLRAKAITAANAKARIKAPDPRLIQARAKKIASQETQTRQARDTKDTSTRSDVLEARPATLRTDLRAMEPRAGGDAEDLQPQTFDVDGAIHEAYLRTVSRKPNPEELELARDYFARSADESKGLRDLLWALLNTKEFMTNH